jgi:hypothetical protein
MVMKPAEQPSRRNRSIKSGRVSIKQGELDQGGTGPPRQESKSGKLSHRFLEYRTESGNCSRLKEHVFEEQKTHAQLLGMQIWERKSSPTEGAHIQRTENSRTASRNGRIESGKLKCHVFIERISHAQHRNRVGTSFESQRRMEPVKGACGDPDSGNGMR